MRNIPLRYAIEWTYDLKDYQIVGPEWIKFEEHYDIIGKAPGQATNGRMRGMLETPLAERFGLKSHIEKRDLPVYALLPGKGAHKLQKPEAGEPPHLSGGPAAAEFHNFPLSRLTFMLTRRMDRPVLDLTGLTGDYDYKVDLTGLGQ